MTGRRPSSILLSLPLLLFLLFPRAEAWAQATGTLQGQLMLPGGEHAGGLLVDLEFRGSPIKSAYASNEGRFAFFELLNNTYHVIIREKGYQPVDRVVVVRPDLNPITYVWIVLRPVKKEESEQPAAPDAVAGGNPNLVSAKNYAQDFPRPAVKEFEAGVKDAEKGKLDNALKHYRKAVKLAPTFYPAYNNMGALYLSQKKFDEAETAFREAMRLNETDANAYFNLGNVCYLTGRNDEAQRHIEQGLLRETLSPLGNHLLGAVLLRRGRLLAAERQLRKALSLDPGMPAVYLELATLYLQQQRQGEAIAELNEFVRLFPDNPLVPKVNGMLAQLGEQGEAQP